MIKLKTDARTPTLTPEQFASMRDALYIFLGGDALNYMGRIAVNDLVSHEHTEYLEGVVWSDITDKPSTFTPEAHEHPEYETDPRIKMWVGTGAISSNPHIVFDTPLNRSAFLMLRFPYSTYRFTVFSSTPNDIENYTWYDTSTG